MQLEEKFIVHCFTTLPKEIINKILEYSGGVVYRNGIYIDRIQKNDLRLAMFKTIRAPIFGDNMAVLQMLNEKSNVFINLNYYFGKKNKTVANYMVYFIKTIEKNEKTQFINSCDGKWWKTIQYVM